MRTLRRSGPSFSEAGAAAAPPAPRSFPGLRLPGLLCLAAVLGLAACGGDRGRTAGEDGAFYADRTLELIVPFGPGGGTDTWTRMVAPFLQEHLGHGTAVQVVNVPGAMSVAGANEFALRRRPDGLTALVSAGTTFFLYLLDEPAVRYEFRELEAILAGPAGGVVFVSPELGVDEPADLTDLRGALSYGGISATGNDLLPLLAFELLELDVRAILGYRSKGETRVAFERGETDIEYQTMPAYLASVVPLVEEGRAVPLFSFGILDAEGNLVRDPQVPELPTVAEVHRTLYGEDPSGVVWDAYRATVGAGIELQKVIWLHGDAPPEAVEELRAAADEMVRDSAFLAAAERQVGRYPFRVGQAAERTFQRAVDVSPEALSWLREFARRERGGGSR